MNKEREPQLPRLTLEIVAQQAQETTLEDGGHAPTLIIEGSNRSVVLQFKKIADTHEGRAAQMTSAGFTMAQESVTGIPKQVFLISEGWLSSAKDGQLPDTSPSQDPNRIEVLIVTGVDLTAREYKGVIFEMKRDDEGQLMALEAHQPP